MVHEATHYMQAIKDCQLDGSPNDDAACYRYFSRLNGLTHEFVADLDLIGWPEFCQAGAGLAAASFEPTLEGAERLKEAALALCEHLKIMIERFGRDPSNWKPLGGLFLPHLVPGASYPDQIQVNDQYGIWSDTDSHSAKVGQVLTLRQKLELRDGLQTASYAAVFIALAIHLPRYRFDPGERSYAAAEKIYTDLVGVYDHGPHTVGAERIKDFLRFSTRLLYDPPKDVAPLDMQINAWEFLVRVPRTDLRRSLLKLIYSMAAIGYFDDLDADVRSVCSFIVTSKVGKTLGLDAQFVTGVLESAVELHNEQKNEQI